MTTTFAEKCSIIGDLWLFYREDIEGNEAWEHFFAVNDIALPLAHMINYDLVLPSGDGQAEMFIDQTWEMFCKYIEIDSEGWYQNLDEAFSASDHGPLNG